MRTKKGIKRVNQNAAAELVSNIPIGDTRDKRLAPQKTKEGRQNGVPRQYR